MESGQVGHLEHTHADDKSMERWRKQALALSWVSLFVIALEGGVGIAAGIAAGSIALIGFGIDSVIEGLASVIVIWRFTGHRIVSAMSEVRAQRAVAISFWLLAPYVAVQAVISLVSGDRPSESPVGIALVCFSLISMPLLGIAKQRLGAKLHSAATRSEGSQNMLCAYMAAGVLVGLLANSFWGIWWLDAVVALGIAAAAVSEGRKSWRGEDCGCATAPLV